MTSVSIYNSHLQHDPSKIPQKLQQKFLSSDALKYTKTQIDLAVEASNQK